MKNRIYKYLDKLYPIKDNIIDLSFDDHIHTIVENIFGVTDINFFDWVKDRCDNQYAFVHSNGSKYYYINGKLHRDNDNPAVIYPDGSKHWFQNGKLHRDNDLPAVILPDGAKYWYINNERHRDNDKPAMINANGNKHWYQYGKKHR